MKKNMMTPANGHRIQGISSESFLDANEILNNLDLKGDEVFMDAGCGDGHIAMEARKLLNDNSRIYAVDIYEPSIDDLKKQIEEENINNIISLLGDFTNHVNVPNDSIDVVLMVNVFHGFNAVRKLDESVEEFKRIIKPGGKIAIMDYKKQEAKHGPPYPIRMDPKEIEDLFNKHGLKCLNLINDIGEDIETGKSHYLIIFTK